MSERARGEDLFQYGKRRRLILDNFGYRKIPLVVSDSMFKDQWEICDLMNEYNVDFKRGMVKRMRRHLLCAELWERVFNKYRFELQNIS